MGRRAGQTRERMLLSAVALLRERGAAGISIDAVLARSEAPRGSVYHHFPGGRNEMIIDAVRLAGDYITALIDEAAESGDARVALRRFAEIWRISLIESDYQAGCPIVALAVDSGDEVPGAENTVREIFTGWQEKIRELLIANGTAEDDARRLSTLAVATIEGAVILCRAHRSAAPLDDAVAAIMPLFPETAR